MINFSKLEKAPVAYTFDDFVLEPIHSDVKSRKDPDVSVNFDHTRLSIPIFSSPMNTITEESMIKAMCGFGGSAVLHRYMSVEDQIKVYKNLIDYSGIFFIAVGVNEDLEQRLDLLYSSGVRRFCVDVANGHNKNCIDAVKFIMKKYPDSVVMAGNVSSYDGTLALADAGASLIRIGIGSGSLCITRVVTGHGIPLLSSLNECSKVKHVHPNVMVIADGGIRSSGDIVKSLAIGADAVMLGGLLSGSSETPGEVLRDSNTDTFYKYYSGMASEAARESWFDRTKTSWVPEGESMKIAYKGSTEEIIKQLIGGLKVGMSYSDSLSIEELRQKSKWVRITNAGIIEGTAHGKKWMV